MDLVNLLDAVDSAGTTSTISSGAALCNELSSVLRLVGIVVFGIKVVVPIILIIIGMIDMAKAVTEKSEDKIKAAQNALIKKAIAAAIVFFIVTLVGLLMKVVGSNEYSACMTCINDPWSCNTSTTGTNAGGVFIK